MQREIEQAEADVVDGKVQYWPMEIREPRKYIDRLRKLTKAQSCTS
jgi:hypothetical protein